MAHERCIRGITNGPGSDLTLISRGKLRQHGLDEGCAYGFVEDERGPFDFVLATGGDHTDEDLFERLSEYAFSIHFGTGGSLATPSFCLSASVRRLSKLLITSRS